MTRIFLGVVGVAYLFLAGWCAWQPAQTSASVGFTLTPGAGNSEFLTVYGGLEFALGVVFLWPWFRPARTEGVLLLCVWLHGCLVVFRSAGFFLYQDIPAMTRGFAVSEWCIFLLAIILSVTTRPVRPAKSGPLS
jgi:Domain of unknown function (DUF4345)